MIRLGNEMSTVSRALQTILAALLLLLNGLAVTSAAGQKKEEPPAAQLPAELHGAKIYRIPEETAPPGTAVENPVIYKGLSYNDINWERLILNLALSVKPVDRAATIRKIYFQDVRVSGVPVHIETFETEFKLSKSETVDLPAPLKCAFVYSDLESVAPLKEVVAQDKLRITGQTFIEVKLNPLEKIAMRAKRLVIPVTLNEEVPLQMFSGNPVLQMAAGKILDTLADPSSAAALALARERLQKMMQDQALTSSARPSLYLVYCEYVLWDPKTGAAEKFSQSGTGFVVSSDGRLLTAKRVIEPWKFDPQIAFFIERDHLKVDTKSTRLAAWPAGAKVLGADGHPDFQAALSTEAQTLKVLKIASDRMEKQDYQDPDSGEKATLSLHTGGENDVAVLQLVGSGFQPLAMAEPGSKLSAELKGALFGFPFGLSQVQADPKPIWVTATPEGTSIKLERALNPGESGAPLVSAEGKALALCGGPSECTPLEMVRRLLP
jgi:S1-C subfamily serine protease